MRIALYDGIVETHVASSLERALVARGHQVFNTGKIGHGYEFARSDIELSRLDAAVQSVIDFAPDWVLVFRPASLPARLLSRLRSHGIQLAAWLSDDPVLFDLTYGPIVTAYDTILHCGNARVLSFYEDTFGYATGINMPFWTDHVAFPRVWGTEDPISQLIFLGNLHDEVRRSRYFDLSRLGDLVTAYGNPGTDYFGINAGYLDSDCEVVAAGARSKVALSVPQYFSDHRGLNTWFGGLGDLGFFEYPSRVVQYMAMGLPIINVVKSESSFPATPEIIVCDSFDDVPEIFSSIDSPQCLARLSHEIGQRFDRHFSAASRALLLEDVFENDSWKRLDAQERAVWFTEFDGVELGPQVESFEVSPRRSTVAIGTKSFDISSRNSNRVGLVGTGWTCSSSRLCTIERALVQLGHDLTVFNPYFYPGIISDAPARSATKLFDPTSIRRTLSNLDVLCFAGIDVSLDANAREMLDDIGVKTILFLDDGVPDFARLKRASDEFDVVAVRSSECVSKISALEKRNVFVVPPFVDKSFLDLVKSTNASLARRVRYGPLPEESQAPCFFSDLAIPATEADTLSKLSLSELAKELRSCITYLSFGGTRAKPRLSQLAVYAYAAADIAVIPRTIGTTEVGLLSPGSVQVRTPSEPARKLGMLGTSRWWRSQQDRKRRWLLHNELSAERAMAQLLSFALASHDAQTGTEKNSPDLAISQNRSIDRTSSIAFTKPDAKSAIIRVSTSFLPGALPLSAFQGRFRVRYKSVVLAEFSLAQLPCEFIVTWARNADRKEITFELSYGGAPPLLGTIGVFVTSRTGSFAAIGAGRESQPRVWLRS